MRHARTMRTLLTFAAILAMLGGSSAAVGEWPEFLKSQYIEDSCVPAVVDHGYEEGAARNFCTCFADQLEASFSPFEYEQLIAATPDPNGDSVDQRVYAALVACRPQE